MLPEMEGTREQVNKEDVVSPSSCENPISVLDKLVIKIKECDPITIFMSSIVDILGPTLVNVE
jgi:hypothetical protein